MSLTSTFNNLWDKLQTFYSKIDWSKVIPFFLFLILAFIFWLLIFFQNKAEGSFSIPLKYVNIPEDEVFVNDPPEHIDVRIVDLGSSLFNYYFFKQNDSLEIDVAKIQKESKEKPQINQLAQLIRSKLTVNTELVGYTPAIISLETSKLYSKTVPVVFDGEMRTSAGHLVIDSVSIIPNEVKIYGTADQLREINQISTEYTVFENLKATSQLEAKLKSTEGIRMQTNKVDVYIPIHEFTERQFEIPITVSNEPDDLDVKFFPSKAKVTFAVTLDDYKKISPNSFEITLDYNNLKNIAGDQVELKLSQHPESIKNPYITPGVVEFLFEEK